MGRRGCSTPGRRRRCWAGPLSASGTGATSRWPGSPSRSCGRCRSPSSRWRPGCCGAGAASSWSRRSCWPGRPRSCGPPPCGSGAPTWTCPTGWSLARRLPGPDAGRTTPFFPTGQEVGYHTAMEVRFVAGSFLELGPATAWMRMRHPLVPDEAPSPLCRVLIAADSGNGVSAALDYQRWRFINPDLTVYLMRPPAGDWVALEATTTAASAASAWPTPPSTTAGPDRPRRPGPVHRPPLGGGAAAEGEGAHPDAAQEGGDDGGGQDEGGDAAARAVTTAAGRGPGLPRGRRPGRWGPRCRGRGRPGRRACGPGGRRSGSCSCPGRRGR